MERDDSVLLHEPDLMLAVLRVAAASAGSTLDACIAHLRELREYAGVEHRVPEAEVRARLQAVTVKLDRASLIEWPEPGEFRITARGRQVLADHPSGVDDSVLLRLAQSDVRTGASDRTPPRPAPAPSAASAYDLGHQAFGEGLSLADNPYSPDACRHLDWQNGWSQARDEAGQKNGVR